jgi:hypothetical protein
MMTAMMTKMTDAEMTKMTAAEMMMHMENKQARPRQPQ